MKLSTAVILTLATMCLLDVAATQYELLALNVQEANTIMLPVIRLGWASVWAIKISIAVMLVIGGRELWRHLIGRVAISFAAVAYVAVTGCHVAILWVQ